MAALVFMPFSCSKEAVKENPLTDNSSQLIKISGEDANAATKTTLDGLVTSWNVGDRVGVYCPGAQGVNGWENIPYTASSTASSSAFTGSLTWGGGSFYNFYAYYPYNSYCEPWGNHWGVVPISLAYGQTQSAGNSSSHLSALDFMVATPVSPALGVEGTSTSVNLRYNHVFTILEFQIKGTGTLKAISLTVPTNPIAFSGGTIDITKATPATGISYTIGGTLVTSNQVVVTLGSAPTLSTTTATTVYMVINPGTQTGTCIIGLDNGTTTSYISRAAPGGGFLRGKKYVVAIAAADAAAATVPGTPTIGTATAGDEQARVTFTASASNGGSAITKYTVTSNPGSKTGTGGTASSIIVTGLTNGTAYTFTVTATNTIGTSMASSASNSVTPGPVPTVIAKTGKTWMDRNLGATQVATNSTDEAAYGYLYQWGRGTDGHQIRTSGTTSNLSGTDIPGHANFILPPNTPFDWRSPQKDNLWQVTTDTNNPCPSGFRIPTEAELEAERASWSSQNSAGASASPLKFTVAGNRSCGDGSLYNVGSYGYYWSSTVTGGVTTTTSRHLDFNSSGAYMGSGNRADGFSVRCIKE